MIWRARQVPALEPFTVTRRAGSDPTPGHHRRDESRSAAQARRPETIGFHLLIRQSSQITILVARIRLDFVANMAMRHLADQNQKQLLSLLRAEEIGITLSGEDQLDPRAISR